MKVIVLFCLISFAAALPAPQSDPEHEEPYAPGFSPDQPGFSPDQPGFSPDQPGSSPDHPGFSPGHSEGSLPEKDENEYLVHPPEHERPEGVDHSNNYEEHKEENNSGEEVPVIVILETNKPSFLSNFFSNIPSFTWPPKFTWPSFPFSWPIGGRQPKFAYQPYFDAPQYLY